MPCNSVAVVQLQLAPAEAFALTQQPAVLRTLVQWLAQTYRVAEPKVTETPYATYISVSPTLSLTVTPQRGIEVVGSAGPAEAEQIEAFCRQLGIAQAQMRFIAQLRQKGTVLSTERAANGAVVLTVNL